MPSTREDSQAKGFISTIFKIVSEMLNTARVNKQEIRDLLNNQDRSVDSLFEKLALQVENNSTDTTHGQITRYNSLIDAARRGDDRYINGMTSEGINENSN